MKRYVIIILALFSCCTNNSKVDQKNDYFFDSITVIKYQHKETFNHILDDIVNTKNIDHRHAYILNFRYYFDYFDLSVSIADLNSINPIPKITLGYFYYNGRVLIFDVSESNDYLLKSTEKKSVFYTQKQVNTYEPMIDDKNLEWMYRINYKDFKITLKIGGN